MTPQIMMDWVSTYSGYIVLLTFFTAFIGIAIWAYRPSNKTLLEAYRDIPFRETK